MPVCVGSKALTNRYASDIDLRNTSRHRACEVGGGRRQTEKELIKTETGTDIADFYIAIVLRSHSGTFLASLPCY